MAEDDMAAVEAKEKAASAHKRLDEHALEIARIRDIELFTIRQRTHDLSDKVNQHGGIITTIITSIDNLSKTNETQAAETTRNTKMLGEVKEAFLSGNASLKTLGTLGKVIAWFLGVMVALITIYKMAVLL